MSSPRARRSACSASRARGRSKLFGQLRHQLEQIADQAEVGDLEDRRFLVLVDGDDQLAILHAGEVLDRARYADRYVDFGGDDLAGLADLVIVGRIAGVDRGAARADGGAQFVGQRIDICMELLGGAERAAARDDDLGAGQLGPLARGDLGADEGGEAGVGGGGGGGGYPLRGAGGGPLGGLFQRGGAHRQQL